MTTFNNTDAINSAKFQPGTAVEDSNCQSLPLNQNLFYDMPLLSNPCMNQQVRKLDGA